MADMDYEVAYGILRGEFYKLKAENDRLRAALRDLLICADSECVSGSSNDPIEAAKSVLRLPPS